jgi:HD-GYP domain-containing protein (c-di-GMP phosphodiesterase class II)
LNISGVSVPSLPPSLPISLAADEPAPGEIPPAPESEPIAPMDESADEGERAKGVLRNLLAGHFRGVADVRLRINFQAELTAIQNESASTAVNDALPAVQAAVTTAGTALEESGELTEEQAVAVDELETAFLEEVQSEVETAQGTAAIDTSALADTLRTAFDQFEAAPTEALSTLVEAEAVEAVEGEEPIEPAEPTLALSESFQAILTALRDDFEVALTTLESSVADAQALPELSEPNGNGGAHDKFLAIYESLFNVSEPAPPSEGDLVETQV